MGSFAAQAFLAAHPDKLSALVLSGTAALDQLFAVGDASATLASVNSAFEPARTPFDWLSRDEAEVDAYAADPLCGFELDPASQASIGAAVSGALRSPGVSAAAAAGLPVYIISGECDPIVGPDQKYARAVADGYAAMGIADLKHRIYSGGRHEMFNETNREEVVRDLIAWLDTRLRRRRAPSDTPPC